MLARWMKNSLAALLAPPDKTSNADLVFKVRAADPLLLLVAHALLDNGERLIVLLRVEAQLLEVSDHGGKVGTRVLSEAEVAQNGNMIYGNCESPGKKGGRGDACSSKTREVSPDALVHHARLHCGLDHLVLSQDMWQQVPEKELSAQKDFHGRAVVEAE